jgi:transcriptional regulator with XRE-family HTH domain
MPSPEVKGSATRGENGAAAGSTAGRPAKPEPGRRITVAQNAIGNFLRATRTAQNLTQEQVASMTRGSPWKLSRAAISAIERGQNFPGMEAMLALSNVLFVDPKELVERARLSTVVPVDITGIPYEELEKRASRSFWNGDFRKALSIYDAMLEKVALEAEDDSEEDARRLALLEVRRATALKRVGALLSAIATAERAISLSVQFPDIQAEAYVVLASLQCQRGHLPLASDAAQRAVELSRAHGPRTQGWARLEKARVEYLAGNYDKARQEFFEARKQAELAGDDHHLTHIDGDIGMCWLAQGQSAEAHKWISYAVDSARRRSQPALEASWLIELGKIELGKGRFEEADEYALAALRIAVPRDHHLTIFRAEWLRHRVVEQTNPHDKDIKRLTYLRKLFMHLDQHEGIEEIQEFRKTAMRSMEGASSER